MLKREERYDFRKRICDMHKKIKRNKSVLPNADEFSLDKGVSVFLADKTDVALFAAKDFLCQKFKFFFAVHT